MLAWILVFWIIRDSGYSAPTTAAVSFHSHTACEEALASIKQSYSGPKGTIDGVCVPDHQ